ncbi:SDR family NAD(P)-dependent oxidoreductase [Novosphingobium sp. G106]|uniref:SDR family NAD(P)-dependent oxidoreductase n=1 Tax=Novosphingobium sp. G106 TaxID=2849500 RepID=UPI001C2D7E94|nr:SDR family NAD(P)-dependent oxidoreductase [Novosphingobium sp. G106]MBV1688937.1 SDR family NAD(P)-dependent oxidoreductase [Novosphingobium sp. G106]
MQECRGKVAVVTGGACGIGLGMSRALLDAGMKVIVADVRSEHLDEGRAALANLGDVRFLQLDVADRQAVIAAADEAERMFGKVHLLANNAGVGAQSDVADDDFALWDWLMAINVGGVVNGVKAFLPKLRAHGEGGHIVNTASFAAFLPIPGETSAYSISKASVWALTDALRLSLEGEHIGVSLLVPYVVQTRAMANLRVRAEDGQARQAFDLSEGMDPMEMGRIAVAGIIAGKDYIFASAEPEALMRARFDAVLQDLQWAAQREKA